MDFNEIIRTITDPEGDQRVVRCDIAVEPGATDRRETCVIYLIAIVAEDETAMVGSPEWAMLASAN